MYATSLALLQIRSRRACLSLDYDTLQTTFSNLVLFLFFAAFTQVYLLYAVACAVIIIVYQMAIAMNENLKTWAFF
jgi:hypothetical protein